jgi:cytosine/adenosine deaminase-related metal-dependent hydrolase
MGLDGMALDDDADALRELRLLWHHQQGTALEGAVSTRDLCDAAFVTGRRTITSFPGGAIETGMAADLLVLDYAAMTPDVLDERADELDLLISRGRKEYVRALIVAGRTIVQDGVIVSIDLPALEGELGAQARKGGSTVRSIDPLRWRHRAALQRYYACNCHRCPEGV